MSYKPKLIYTAGVVGVLALGMLVGGVVIWQMRPGAATAGEGPPTPSGAAAAEEEALEPDAYSDIVRLRRAVRLSDGVVAAIGCDGEAAEAAIEKLKGWYASNEDTWSLRRADVRVATKALAAARHRLRTGGRDDALAAGVAGMAAAIAAARRAERELLAGAVREVESVLTDEQQAAWSAVRANPAGAGRYAHAPNVTAAQLAALNMAHWKLARRQAAAEPAAERAAAKQAFRQTLTSTLTAVQRQALATAAANIAEHFPAVLAASGEVLPGPPDDDPGVTVEPVRHGR